MLFSRIRLTSRVIHHRTFHVWQPRVRYMSQASEKQPIPPDEDNPAAPSKSALKKEAKKQKKADDKLQKKQATAQQPLSGGDFASKFYGVLPLNQSQSRGHLVYTPIASLSTAQCDQPVLFRARVSTSRGKGKFVFFNFRQRDASVQGVLALEPERVSKQMIKWATALVDESVVRVEGIVRPSPEPIKSATISDVEIQISKLHLITGIDGRLPFSLDDASRPESDFEALDSQFNRVHLDTRLNSRVLDLRTPTNQAIFKLQSVIGSLCRDFLNEKGFLEIHTPKLQGAATESGASVFKVGYFKGDAFLAQSPQLAKQMAIAADFERVYEIGPVFRAEDSNTHRHMTEFVGIDLEMAIEEHYHEVLELLDDLLKSVFRGLRDKHQKEIEQIRKQFPADEFKWREGPEGTLKLTFREAVNLLVEGGIPRESLDDINTENERYLGRIVKEKYDTDYFIIDKYPIALRPFYTMPDPHDPTLSNSFDVFMRGEEIISGAQRIHEPGLLCAKMHEKGVDPETMKAYVDGFKMACPPHGGAGIGLERVLMFFLKLNNIRRASLFPRDPKRLEP